MLQRAPSPSVNFPNPNTHHFYGPATLYSLPQSRALGAHLSARPRPSVPIVDDIPAAVPLPPTPPPKDSPHLLPSPFYHKPAVPAPPASLLRRPIPPSRRLPHHRGALPPFHFPSPQLPPDVFHPPPTLPRRSAFYPLNPRPQYIPSREAPAPPVEVAESLGLSSTTPALLRGRPELCERPIRRHRLWFSWTVGIPVGGVACLGTGIVLVANNAPYESIPAGAKPNVEIAAVVLCVVGFIVICGTTLHFFCLSLARKFKKPQQDMEEGRGTKTRAGYALENSSSGFSRSTRRIVSARGQGASMEEANELSLVSTNGGRSSERCPRPRNEAAQRTHRNARHRPIGPPDSLWKGAVFEQTGKRREPGVVLHAKGGHNRGSSRRTNFLDLEDEVDNDEESVGDAPANVNGEDEDKATQQIDPPAKSSHETPRAELQRRQQHQQCEHAPFKSTSETPRTAQWVISGSLTSYRTAEDSRRIQTMERTDSDAEGDSQMRDIVRYTSSFNRLAQNGLLQDQRHGHTDPAQEQAVHVPRLAIRISTDFIEAARPVIKRKAIAQSRRLKGKHVEEEHAMEENGNDDGDKATQSTNSRTPSDTDFGELMSLAARSSGFLSVSNLPPLPDLTKSLQSGSQRPSPHRCSVSDFLMLDSFRTTTSISASPTERGPGDLILRMRKAHKRSESSGRLPLVRNPVVGEGSEYMLATLLPATTYIPNGTRHGAGRIAQPSMRSTVEPGEDGSLVGGHAQNIAHHDIAPGIQIREVSHRGTEHTVLNAPIPQVAAFCTANPADPPPSKSTTPPPPVSAVQRRRPASSQTLASRRRSSLIEPIPYLPPWQDRVQRLERHWGGAVDDDRSRAFHMKSRSEAGEDEEELRESGFVDEGDESWGGGRAADV